MENEKDKTRSIKVYVDVVVTYDQDGVMKPTRLTWEDGHVYKIDKVRDIRPARAARAGGMGDRYTIVIGNQESYLFYETLPPTPGKYGRWFVERRMA